MLKNPRTLDTFYDSKFSQLLFAGIFLLNNQIKEMLSKDVGWIAFLYVLQSVIEQINAFWFTKTGIV